MNSAHALTTSGLVLGFRVAKQWVFRQKENVRLSKLKISSDLKLQKARIYPEFLFQSLNSLHSKMISGSADSPKIILTLSDLLSYLLYESAEEMISLEKELNMIVNLLSIETINQAHHLTIHSKIKSDSDRHFVRPLILFPLLQNCFETLGSREKEHHAFYVEITEISQMLHVVLVIEQMSASNHIDWNQRLKNFHAKLGASYQDGYQLQIENHRDRSEIKLCLSLEEGVMR